MASRSTNFHFLDPALDVIGAQAEMLFAVDPAACIAKLRLLAEGLAQELAASVGVYDAGEGSQLDVLRRLSERGVMSREVADLFHGIRKSGNRAAHFNEGSLGDALHQMRITHRLAIWTRRTLSGSAFTAPLFVPPRQPEDATVSLKAEIARLREDAAKSNEAAEAARRLAADEARRRASVEAEAQAAARDMAAMESLLAEAAAQQEARAAELEARQAKSTSIPPGQVEAIVQRAEEASSHLDLDEAETRAVVDAQLRAVGWEANTQELSFARAGRPQKGKNLAIAEWPTENGPADYVLFIGLQAVAVVEAKRNRTDVAGSIEQSKRYARGFMADASAQTSGGPWGDYRVPFLFATNGRPYLKQLETKSGIWFLDARRERNHSRALDGWYSPEGLAGLLAQDIEAADAKLRAEPTEYLGLREYQVRAIKSVEAAIEDGQQHVLVAMATGTGKTRTCIGLCYRLLKTKRFRRILFLVDRSALGIQATNAFNDARLENTQTFTDIFDLKEMSDARPDTDTKIHVATVQAMVHRILLQDDNVPSADQYDAIVVDECHRGYVLDREMGDDEMAFRSEADYVSKYRRVLDHFDAVKIGLTATPALHTVEIFGKPVYEYAYREAVVDGYLTDHEPPIRIVTALAEDGIHWKVGEQVETYSPSTGQVQLSLLPDEVHVDVEQFNKRVITEGFNRVVCEFLAKHIDPSLDEKTLIFCVTDTHADMVVRVLKEEFARQYGEVEDDAVLKITGTADKPIQLLRRYKNERLPNVAVTVDLLTTGVDIPKICNLVFLRRVRSRILYEQMVGRATRLCEEIDKEAFRIYDAVDLYSALAPFSDMKPVVTNPTVSFTQLIGELDSVKGEKARAGVLDQLVAKLDRKRRRLKGDALERFEAAAGVAPVELLTMLRENDANVASKWFASHVSLCEVLDASEGSPRPLLISYHEDEVRRIERGYGNAKRPEDYLSAFAQFLRENMNKVPALLVVTQRPRDLTRQQLKELKLTLDQAGYSETALRTAWKDKTNQDIAASIIGHVRQAALGDALVAYSERVDHALGKILASRLWTEPQKKWLDRIAKQLRAETVVDCESLDAGQFGAKGGFERMNKVFDGQLAEVLGDIQDGVWNEQGAA